MRVGLVRAAVAVLVLQGVAVLAAGAYLGVRSTGDDATTSRLGVIVEALLVAGSGVALLALARAVAPPTRAGAITPAVVVELLALPVAVGLVQGGRAEIGVPLAVLALVAVAGLVGAGARAG